VFVKRYKYGTLLILFLLIVNLAPPALAQQKGVGLDFVVSAGFDGYAKSNAWMPVRISATNDGPDIEGEIRLQTIYPGEMYARHLSLPSQSQKETTIFIPSRNNQFIFEFISDDQTLYQSEHSPRLIPADDFLVGVVASDPNLLNFLAGLQTTKGEPLSVAHLSLVDLPEEPQGLSALDVLIFNDVDTSSLAPGQQAALADWVVGGGHLIVGGGPNGPATASGLLAVLPVAGLTSKTLSALPALASYTNEGVPGQGPYLAAIPESANGNVYITQEGDPLLVTKAVGEGRVTYFALDFGLAPMNGWAGNQTFWERNLAPIEARIPFYATYESMQSINNTLANISVAALPSPASLMAYLCTYLIVLVPLNYVVLKQMKRRELAWITIPVLIILFSLAGYIAGFRSRGVQALLRQVSVVQQTNGHGDNVIGTPARVDTFLGLYSPDRQRYTLKFQDDFLVQPTDSGSGFKGIKNVTSAPTQIYYGNQTELQNLWTDVGSMATAVVHGYTEPQPITLDLEVMPAANHLQVSGVIRNNSQQVLEDAVLLIGDYGVRLGKLEGGERQINHTLSLLDVQPSFSDITIWGDFYYQLDDREAILNDQIIRSIFWPDSHLSNQQPSNAPATDIPQEAILFGWSSDSPPETEVEVVDHRVGREAINLFIIRSSL
jgi:hypothetical protein